eukprot:CAMPEP_0172699086 /NCGR_PEP_ID=MMETSP1074-20121228/29918_1 /TAXON_ID=2916 /ORGANISM="Ceratium fusus, Strain PA161109" /LENGTH=760 /DNA_ID=CAMNT_0013520227 /DNA_START=101 /DNA_END=2381 /DNA_ORIENTATION=-
MPPKLPANERSHNKPQDLKQKFELMDRLVGKLDATCIEHEMASSQPPRMTSNCKGLSCALRANSPHGFRTMAAPPSSLSRCDATTKSSFLERLELLETSSSQVAREVNDLRVASSGEQRAIANLEAELTEALEARAKDADALLERRLIDTVAGLRHSISSFEEMARQDRMRLATLEEQVTRRLREMEAGVLADSARVTETSKSCGEALQLMREQLAAFRRRLQQHHGDSNRVLEQLSSIQQTLHTVQCGSTELQCELARVQQWNQEHSCGLVCAPEGHRHLLQKEEGHSKSRQVVSWTDVEGRLLQLNESLSLRMQTELEAKQEELRRWCSSELVSSNGHVRTAESLSLEAAQSATTRCGRSRSLDQAIATKNHDLASYIPRNCQTHGSPSTASDMRHGSISEKLQELRRQDISIDACRHSSLAVEPELDALHTPCRTKHQACSDRLSPAKESNTDSSCAPHELSATTVFRDASFSTSTIDQLPTGSMRRSGHVSLIDSSPGDRQTCARQLVHQGRSPGSRWSSPGSVNSHMKPTLVGHSHPSSSCDSGLIIAALEERAAAAATEATEMVTWARHAWPEQLEQLMAQVEGSAACAGSADAAKREAVVAQAAASSAAAHARDVQSFAELAEAALAASVDAKMCVEIDRKCKNDENQTAHLCLQARVDAVEVAQRVSLQEWHAEAEELSKRQMLLGATLGDTAGIKEPAWAAQIREVENNMKSLLAAQAEDSAAALKWLASLLAETSLPGVPVTALREAVTT